MSQQQLQPGQRVRVRQEIERREDNWVQQVEGTIVALRREKTGSWFAHGKDDKLWLDRLRLQKDDGEITTLVIDEHTHIEVVAADADAEAE